MAEQLTYGDSKTPFYPLIENGITLIELNSSITDLVTSSSPEDIEQAFDGVENFDNLIAALRLSGTVINGITIATDTEAGNMTADVVVSKNENKVVIRWIDENYQYVLTVTKSAEGTFSCTKTSLLLGSEVDLSNYLSKTNTSSYTPTNNYNPATKKYVDDNIVASFNIVSTDGATASFSQENYNKLVEAITNNQNIIIVYLDNSNNTTKSLVSSAVNSEGNITLKTHSINNENGDITYNEFVILGSTFTNNVTINSKTFQIESGVAVIPVAKLTNSSENVDWIIENIIPAIQNNRVILIQVDPSTTGHVVANVAYAEDLNLVRLEATTDEKVIYYQIDTNAKTITDSTSMLAKADEVLTKTNTEEFIPTEDYQPATKKYVDDHHGNYPGGILNIGENNVSYDEDIINYGYISIFLSGFGNIVIPIRISGGKISEYRTLVPVSESAGVGESAYSLVNVIMSDLTKNVNKYEGTINVTYLYRMITESKYSALGTTPNTDNVLYFVIPDA